MQQQALIFPEVVAHHFSQIAQALVACRSVQLSNCPKAAMTFRYYLKATILTWLVVLQECHKGPHCSNRKKSHGNCDDTQIRRQALESGSLASEAHWWRDNWWLPEDKMQDLIYHTQPDPVVSWGSECGRIAGSSEGRQRDGMQTKGSGH